MKEEITPETYKKMNEEFIEDDLQFRITIPTQEEIDEWRSESIYLESPPEPDLVDEIWKKHSKIARREPSDI